MSISHSEKETERFAARFAKTLRGGEIILLEGELGAGKTVFVRGLARALGVRGRITSPTFVLMRVHLAGIRHSPFVIRRFVHADAYRVNDPRELESVGLLEWAGRPDTVVAIEWGDRVRELFPRSAQNIRRIRLSAPAKTERIIGIR